MYKFDEEQATLRGCGADQQVKASVRVHVEIFFVVSGATTAWTVHSGPPDQEARAPSHFDERTKLFRGLPRTALVIPWPLLRNPFEWETVLARYKPERRNPSRRFESSSGAGM